MAPVLHTCPVCGADHFVPAGLHRLSYGRQLACSPRCKDALPRLARARVLAEMAEARRAAGKAESS